jgi:hypothetical protein
MILVQTGADLTIAKAWKGDFSRKQDGFDDTVLGKIFSCLTLNLSILREAAIPPKRLF